MGISISARQFFKEVGRRFSGLVIYCLEAGNVTSDAISMNVAIARRLADISPSMRSMRLESCFVSALSKLPEGVVIRDVDVLFNPAYQIDALALLVSAYRKHAFDLVWPGRFEDNHLIYAEEGCPDYRVFNIDRYDITCIY